MRFKILSISLFAFVFIALPAHALNVHKLSAKDSRTLDSLLAKLGLVVEKKEVSDASVLLTFDELKAPLSWREKRFINSMMKLKPKDLNVKTPEQPQEKNGPCFMLVRDQNIMKDGKPLKLAPQAVSKPAYAAYQKMVSAMQKETGKKLGVESGHRSRAYHLYNFLKYLKEHDYSLIDTAKLNALPGYSEHNLFIGHAVDLISSNGVNGDPHVEDYEKLAEHQWMLKHAGEYGFTLSYPRGNPHGIDYEPWHWKFNPSEQDIRTCSENKS